MKQRILQTLQDNSVPDPTEDSYELRIIRDNDFEKIAEIISKLYQSPIDQLSSEGEAIDFLDHIRDYERESGNQICYDERTSKELYDLYKESNK